MINKKYDIHIEYHFYFDFLAINFKFAFIVYTCLPEVSSFSADYVKNAEDIAMYCGTIIVLVLVFPVPVLAENNTHKQNIMAELSKIQFNMKPDSTILYNVRTDEQDDIDSRIWGGVNLKKAASHIGDRLRELANDELGVTTLQVKLTFALPTYNRI